MRSPRYAPPEEAAPVKLPRSWGEVRVREHPIFMTLKLMRRTDIARHIGISHNSIITAENRATEDRDFLIPARWVRAYSGISGLPPFVFRPDLFLEEWAYPKIDIPTPEETEAKDPTKKKAKKAKKANGENKAPAKPRAKRSPKVPGA